MYRCSAGTCTIVSNVAITVVEVLSYPLVICCSTECTDQACGLCYLPFSTFTLLAFVTCFVPAVVGASVTAVAASTLSSSLCTVWTATQSANLLVHFAMSCYSFHYLGVSPLEERENFRDRVGDLVCRDP